jgi:hypothetical protein
MLALLCLGVLLAWFWQDSLAARGRANAAAMDACARLNLQLLDGTVAFTRLQLTRGADGRLGLRRTYVFDYTANSIERRQGFVILTRERIESVGFAPGEEERSRPQAPPPPAPEPRTNPSNVLDLDDWRSRQRRSQRPSEWREDRGDRRQ